MKTLRTFLLLSLALLEVAGAQDPGKEVIGQIRTGVLFGTNGPLTSLGDGVTVVSAAEKTRLQKVSKLEPYRNFVELGSVEQHILKGYKSWAQPIRNSQALMLRAELETIGGISRFPPPAVPGSPLFCSFLTEVLCFPHVLQ